MRHVLLVVGALAGVAVLYSFGLLPPEVYGALLGALLTLFGILLKSGADERLKATELAHNVKREVFIEVAEALGRVEAYFTKLGTPGPEYETAGEVLSPSIGWSQKLELVASVDTLRAARVVTSVRRDTELELVKRQEQLRRLRYEGDKLEREAARLRDDRRDTMDSISAEIAKPDSPMRLQIVQALNETYMSLGKQLGENSKQQDGFSDERIRLNAEIPRIALRGLIDVRKYVAALQLAIRRDLGFDVAAEQYQRLVGESEADYEAKLARALEYIEGLWRRDAG